MLRAVKNKQQPERTEHIHVRVTAEEKERIQALAAHEHLTVSDLLRQMALKAARRILGVWK